MPVPRIKEAQGRRGSFVRVYFAEPIDMDQQSAAEFNLRERMVSILETSGVLVYRPARAWKVDRMPSAEEAATIESVNRVALAQCDAIIARMPESTVTHGVPMELEYATRTLGIPAVVVGRAGVALMANDKVRMMSEEQIEFEFGFVVMSLIEGPRWVPSRPEVRYSGPATLAQGHTNDAGIDLTAIERVVVKPGSSELIRTGVRMAIPPGMFAWVTARSSTWGRWGCIVLPGVIDETYQGELMVHALNLSQLPVTVHVGDRVGQVLLMANGYYGRTLTRVEDGALFPTSTTRGASGFGSTG